MLGRGVFPFSFGLGFALGDGGDGSFSREIDFLAGVAGLGEVRHQVEGVELFFAAGGGVHRAGGGCGGGFGLVHGA